MEYPKTLYVIEEPMIYPYYELKHLIGKETIESAVRDNNEENVVAVYQLVEVRKYKKIVTTTAVIERV